MAAAAAAAAAVVIRTRKRMEEEDYFRNVNNFEGQIYYGLIGMTYGDWGEVDSANLIVNKVVDTVIKVLETEYRKYRCGMNYENRGEVWENIVFYEIKNQNPYVLSMNILTKLSDCRFVTIIENYRPRKYMIHNKNLKPNIADYTNFIKEFKNRSFNATTLYCLICNKSVDIKYDVILYTLKSQLKKLPFHILKSMCKDINIKVKWYRSRYYAIKQLIIFFKINILYNDIIL